MLTGSGCYCDRRQFSGALTRKAFCLNQRAHIANARRFACAAPSSRWHLKPRTWEFSALLFFPSLLLLIFTFEDYMVKDMIAPSVAVPKAWFAQTKLCMGRIKRIQSLAAASMHWCALVRWLSTGWGRSWTSKGKNILLASQIRPFSSVRLLICEERPYSTHFPEPPCIIYKNPRISLAQGC